MTEPVLVALDLRVWYGTEAGPVRAVDGVSFELRPGETLGLVGESGCGKSTLGRGLLGLLPRGAKLDGEVDFQGTDLVTARPKELQRLRGPHLGLIFQEPLTRLNPLLRISEHFEETLRAHEPGLTEEDARHRALAALRAVGIPPTRYRAYPHEFSGGMRQRIMIALALVLRPAFVVADEPTTALDVLVEAQIIQILADLRRSFDTALLLITHNLGTSRACDRVAVMYAGRIVGPGRCGGIRSPQHPYTRELLRSPSRSPPPGCTTSPAAHGPGQPAAGLPVPPALPGRDAGVPGEDPAAHHRGRRPGGVLAARAGRPGATVRPGAAEAGGGRRCRRRLRYSRRPRRRTRRRWCGYETCTSTTGCGPTPWPG